MDAVNNHGLDSTEPHFTPCFTYQGESTPIEGVGWASAPLRFRERQLLSAVQTMGRQIHLVSWRVNAGGHIVRTGGSATSLRTDAPVSIARGAKFVTATSWDGQLDLKSWDISSTGAIHAVGENEQRPLVGGAIAILAMTERFFIVATCALDHIKLTTWRLQNDDTLTPLQVTTVGLIEITEIQLLHMGEGRFLLAAGCHATDQCQLTLWQVDDDESIASVGEGVLLHDTAPKLVAVADSDNHLVIGRTLARTLGRTLGGGRTQLSLWSVSRDGTFAQIGEGAAIGEGISITALIPWANGGITALQQRDGTSRLARWETTPEGFLQNVGMSDTFTDGISQICLCAEALSGTAPLVVSVRTERDELRLISWGCDG